MVQVVVTGGAGFLGSRLAGELLAAGSLEVAGRPARPVSQVTLIDRAPVPPRLAGDGRVRVVRGDLAGPVSGRNGLPGSACSRIRTSTPSSVCI